MAKQTPTETHDDDLDFEELDTDFSETEEAEGFGALPADFYLAECAAVEVRTGAKGKYLNFEFHILEPEQYAGRKVWDIASFAEKSKPYTLKTLGVIAGQQIPRAPFRLSEWEDRLVGQIVRLRIAPREYEGQQQDDVKAILPANGGSNSSGFESAAARTTRGRARADVFE